LGLSTAEERLIVQQSNRVTPDPAIPVFDQVSPEMFSFGIMIIPTTIREFGNTKASDE
jgi:hypothetical protein